MIEIFHLILFQFDPHFLFNTGAPLFWGDKERKPYCEPPVIPGHEFIGEIVQIGDEVKGDFKIGDQIISEQIVPCKECRFCRSGQYHMCQPHDIYGTWLNTKKYGH